VGSFITHWALLNSSTVICRNLLRSGIFPFVEKALDILHVF